MPEHKRIEYPSPGTAWSTVGVLAFTYMFSILDRQILVLLVDPIRADLQITDTQISLLTGFAFALVYSTMGIPMGRAADLYVRKHIIIFGVAIWSVLTLMCGFAKSFLQLLFARMGVGFGEAALTPTAYSLIADLFPPHRLARGMSVFVLGGIAAGSALSLLLSGAIIGAVEAVGTLSLPVIGELKPWRIVLIVVGALSLLMIIPLIFISEPVRHGVRNDAREPCSFGGVVHYMWDHKAFYGVFIAGMSIANLIGYGAPAWLPTYFIRVVGWEAADTGVALGALYLVPSIVGGLTAGYLADYFTARGRTQAPLVIMMVATLLAAPILMYIVYAPTVNGKVASVAAFQLIVTMLFVLFPTIVQMATPNRIRGQVSAIHLLICGLIGISLGPASIAVVTDYVFRDDLAVGHSIAIVGGCAHVLSALVLWLAIKPFKREAERNIELASSDAGAAAGVPASSSQKAPA